MLLQASRMQKISLYNHKSSIRRFFPVFTTFCWDKPSTFSPVSPMYLPLGLYRCKYHPCQPCIKLMILFIFYHFFNTFGQGRCWGPDRGDMSPPLFQEGGTQYQMSPPLFGYQKNEKCWNIDANVIFPRFHRYSLKIEMSDGL